MAGQVTEQRNTEDNLVTLNPSQRTPILPPFTLQLPTNLPPQPNPSQHCYIATINAYTNLYFASGVTIDAQVNITARRCVYSSYLKFKI
ncbi:hypothetical protein E2C01_002664 [Portunus trituberculatus]|uniref:Uncharacterized protein n=1 Tax=Portunus trituberculatus TaxID=210409 RepID=A0A5B7CKI5_PORTR|nr:hypothetical protein [Portunus trituberculatus]